ncbi:MAG: ComEC/Rec2 family competence protein, partial [Kineosporiaceae bacterium]
MSGGSTGEVAASGRWIWTDLRLVPAAAVTWLVVLVAPRLPSVGSAGVALASGVLALVARRTGVAWSGLLLSLLAAVTACAGASAIRTAAREASPLAAAVRGGLAAEVVLEVDSRPRAVHGTGPPRFVMDATAQHLRLGAVPVDVHDHVLVFAPEQGWDQVLPGATVR